MFVGMLTILGLAALVVTAVRLVLKICYVAVFVTSIRVVRGM